MRTTLIRIAKACSGATAIEYAMIVLFIALLLITLLMSIGTSVTGFFNDMANGL